MGYPQKPAAEIREDEALAARDRIHRAMQRGKKRRKVGGTTVRTEAFVQNSHTYEATLHATKGWRVCRVA